MEYNTYQDLEDCATHAVRMWRAYTAGEAGSSGWDDLVRAMDDLAEAWYFDEDAE